MEQPSGTVTLLFTDIEGSTRLLDELGAEGYREALADHRRVLREAFERHGGYEVDYEGDAFFVAFQEASAGVAAAREGQGALAASPVRVRMGLHTGTPLLDPPKYVGHDVHLAARVMSAGHGGQVLLTQATRNHVDDDLRDLGEHRLKDFAEPVSIYQLGDGSFPPLKTISNTNLPRPASTFVGREREVAEVVELVRGGARLVTLTGPGGSGKTRLAIEAAAELVSQFRAGVFWVGLATLRDPALVPETVAQTLGAKGELAEDIGERELLLLLDNLEQVVEAAPELAGLVEACPNLVLLVTSRELLRVRGEVEYQVMPLAVSDAVDLFAARAGVEPSPAVEDLCRRLDSMPLALELAAARAVVLSPEQILERLSQRLDLFRGGRDADPRQQTLRATIEWSHDLLTTEEQLLFARLSVFAGGCRLEAAQQVADADLDTLQSLADKSLVRRTADRFWMLETIREYALERLASSGEARRLQAAHAQSCLELVEDLGPRLLAGNEQVGAIERLEPELDNLRAAMQFGLDNDTEVLARLVYASGYLFFIRGHDREVRRWAKVASATGAGTMSVRGRLLRFAGRAALYARDLEEARRYFEEALSCARQGADDQWLGEVLRGLGDLATTEGDGRRARSLYEEARAASEACGNERSTASILASLANLALTESRWSDAFALSEESLVKSREIGDQAGEATGLVNLALAALRLGRSSEAKRALACMSTLALPDPEALAGALETLAWLLAAAGRGAASAESLGAAAELHEKMGTTRGTPEQAIRDEAIHRLNSLMRSDELEAAILRGRGLPPESALRRALAALD